MELWGRLGVTCWPTLLLLSPQGVPIHVAMGEGHAAFLTEYLHVAVDFFKGALLENINELRLFYLQIRRRSISPRGGSEGAKKV